MLKVALTYDQLEERLIDDVIIIFSFFIAYIENNTWARVDMEVENFRAFSRTFPKARQTFPNISEIFRR